MTRRQNDTLDLQEYPIADSSRKNGYAVTLTFVSHRIKTDFPNTNTQRCGSASPG